MFHVTVVSPASRTGAVAEWLLAAPGVHNVVVHRGAARRPDGDAVQFDVRQGAANPVFQALRDFDLDRGGPITVQQVDAALLPHGASAADHGALHREQAPVWEMVEAVIHSGETYAPSFYVLLTIAGLIGAVGILTNSQILIVGAMVVGPEYNAIIGAALAIGRRDRRALRDGLVAPFWGFLAAIVVSVTTIPAAADVGVSLAFASWREARGSLLQLMLNVALLILVGAGGLALQHRIWSSRSAAP
jgi:Domain of unknown function (DUF389)